MRSREGENIQDWRAGQVETLSRTPTYAMQCGRSNMLNFTKQTILRRTATDQPQARAESGGPFSRRAFVSPCPESHMLEASKASRILAEILKSEKSVTNYYAR